MLASSSALHTEGGKSMNSDFIVIVDTRRRDNAYIFTEWPSVFFLRSIFSSRGGQRAEVMQWREKELDAIQQMSEKFNLDLDDIYEPVYPEAYSVFPTVKYDSFDYPGRNKYPSKEVWEFHLTNLKDSWGLGCFSDVKPFVSKALMPFFEQIDTSWFVDEVRLLDDGEPLRRLGEALKERFAYEEKVPETSVDYRKAVKNLFRFGSVLRYENLIGGFDKQDGLKGTGE